MALILPCDVRHTISVDDYIESIRALDLRDLDAVAASAPLLRALANDRTLVVRKLNQEVENFFKAPALPSAQTIYLGGGPDFYVRAAIWPPSTAISDGHLYQDKFAYHIAHDHNFTFLTVNYLGPGYETELYEYDREKVEGRAGETIDLAFLEKVRFSSGAMLYRANRDVHIQYPPEELTITLNLMISLPEMRLRDQYYFDIPRRVILDYPPDTEASKRVSLMKMAGHLGNAKTQGLLSDLALVHPCQRTRLAAFEALSLQQPLRRAEIWQTARQDAAALVAHAAERNLKALEKG